MNIIKNIFKTILILVLITLFFSYLYYLIDKKLISVNQAVLIIISGMGVLVLFFVFFKFFVKIKYNLGTKTSYLNYLIEEQEKIDDVVKKNNILFEIIKISVELKKYDIFKKYKSKIKETLLSEKDIVFYNIYLGQMYLELKNKKAIHNRLKKLRSYNIKKIFYKQPAKAKKANSQYFHIYAEYLLLKDNYLDAMKAVNKGINLAGETELLILSLSKINFYRGILEDALANLRKISHSSDLNIYVNANYLLFKIYSEMGRYFEGKKYYDKVKNMCKRKDKDKIFQKLTEKMEIELTNYFKKD